MKGILFIFISAVIPCFFSVETCVPKDVDFEYFDKFRFRYPPFYIEIQFTPCRGYLREYFSWEVKEDGERIVQETTNKDILINGYTYSFPNVYRATYFVEVNVSHYMNMSYSAGMKNSFKFKPRDMNLQIVGGSTKYHPPSKELIVDGLTLSKDTSFSPKENPFELNDVEWTVEPPINELIIPKNTYKLTVPGEFLKHGEKYNFKMKVVRVELYGERQVKEVSQIVIISETLVPELRIICRRNCEHFNHMGLTALSVSCVKNCDQITDNWKWSVDPKIDLDDLDFGDGFDKILLQENSFEPGVKINVAVENGAGHAEFPITFFPDIERGQCDITPKRGVSGITVFRVDCYGFYSLVGIDKYTIYQKFEGMEKGVILTEDNELIHKEIILSEGNPAQLYIEVRDNAYMQVLVFLSAIVEPISIDIRDIKVLILGTSPNTVLSLIKKRLRNELAQTISFLLDAIEKAPSKTPLIKKNLYHYMTKFLYILEPFDIPSLLQVISVVQKMENLKEPTDTLTTRFLAKCVQNSIKALHYIMTHPTEVVPPTFVLNDFLQSILNLCSNFVKEVPEIKEILSQELEANDYDSYDDMVYNRLKIRDDMRDVTESLLNTLQIIGLCALRRDFPNQKKFILESNKIYYVASKIMTADLPELLTFPEYTKAKIYLSPELLKEIEGALEYIEIQVGMFRLNLFWWHKNQTRFITTQITFDIYKDGMKVVDFDEKLYFAFYVKNIPSTQYMGSVSGTVTSDHFQNIISHRILVEPESNILIQFAENNLSYKVKGSNCHCSKEDFLLESLITPENYQTLKVLRHRPDKGADSIYLCFQKITNQDLKYSAVISSFACLYWDMTIGDFVRLESERLDFKQQSPLLCVTNHLSFFTGSLFIPPNYINLNADINFSIVLVENWVMVMIVSSLLLIWAILLLWACLKDRELRRKNFICKLDDNVPGDEHVYLVVVFTGLFIDAGTTADVGFQIIGEKSNSRAHLIKCCNTLLLRRNSQDWFIIYTPKFMGDLKKIRLWHNCKGKEPHWYCQRVLVQHLESGTQYCFLVNEWLSLVWGLGKIYFEVSVKEETHLKSAKVLFAVKLETFKDEHLWLSVFTRAPQSNFTSIERVSTAMSVLFMSMLASAMFFGVPKNTASDSIDTQSTYFITFESILIFIESWVVAVPVGIIIVIIFKNSHPHWGRK